MGKSFLVADVPEPTVFASYLIRIRPKAGLVPEFAFWCFQSQQFWEQLLSQRRGSAMANINGRMLSALEFPLPGEPLQTRIAEFLNRFRQRLQGRRVSVGELPPPLNDVPRLVARIEELAAQIHEARTLRHQAAEEAEALSASWRNSTFTGLAEKYARLLGDVTEIIGGGSLPDTSLVEENSTDVLLVKVSDMNRPGNEVFIRESAFGLPADSPLLRGFRVLPPQSIVFPKRGGAIATNKKRILKKPAVLDPNTMGVFTKQESELCHEFLFKWFNNLDLASLQEGTSVPQINKGDLAPLQIPPPRATPDRGGGGRVAGGGGRAEAPASRDRRQTRRPPPRHPRPRLQRRTVTQ